MAENSAIKDHPGATQFDQEWTRLIKQILGMGRTKPSRQTGVDSRSMSGGQVRVDMGHLTGSTDGSGKIVIRGFPTLHTKLLTHQSMIEELAWFLRGETNAKQLAAMECHIWDDDAEKARARGFDYEEGELGPIYGWQWRKRESGDQISALVDKIITNPYDRGHLVSAWDVDRIPEMVLRPCHYAFQLVCSPGLEESETIRVDCVVSMRSTDVGLGLPFNVASYALLTVLCLCEAAKRQGVPVHDRYELGQVIINMADCHIYEPHVGLLEGAISVLESNSSAQQATGVTLELGPELQGLEEFCGGDHTRRRGIISYPGGWRPPLLRLPLFT